MRAKHIIAAGLCSLPAVASASETTTYSYDAKGRLTRVMHTGGPANGFVRTYGFDPADNRTSTTVAGALLDEGAHAVVVMPLHGMSVVVLPNT